MSKRTRKTYSPEFRFEVAQEVVDNGRAVREVANSLGLGLSTVDKWARQLREERAGTAETYRRTQEEVWCKQWLCRRALVKGNACNVRLQSKSLASEQADEARRFNQSPAAKA